MTRRGEKVFPCAFQRRIKICDSFLFLPTKLDTLIEQTHQAGEKEGLPLEITFPSTLAFLRSKNLTDRQIALVVKNKLQMPHEACRSYQDLLREECPTADQFGSFLQGTTTLNDEEMAKFRLIWQELEIPNLLTLYDYYVQLDCTQLADSVYFFFNKMFVTCHLHPLWFITIRCFIEKKLSFTLLFYFQSIYLLFNFILSGFALQACLLNSSSPDDHGKKLFLPFLREREYSAFESRLLGGYSTTQAYHAHFNHGRISLTDDMKHNHLISWAAFLDANQLYPTVRTRS